MVNTNPDSIRVRRYLCEEHGEVTEAFLIMGDPYCVRCWATAMRAAQGVLEEVNDGSQGGAAPAEVGTPADEEQEEGTAEPT